MRRHDAVRGVGAAHIKIAILEPALALVEHVQRLRFVFFHRGDCAFKHGFGFVCSADTRLPELVGERQIGELFAAPQSASRNMIFLQFAGGLKTMSCVTRMTLRLERKFNMAV